jgi:putative zinc finger protein
VTEANHEMACRLEDVAAYIDGELAGPALEDFEAHLRSCRACVDELRTQKQLLCTLDIAFNDSRSFELPREFSRVVTARAESDLSGVRRKRERRRALQLCAALAVASFALMGAAARGLVIDPLRSIFRVANTLLDFAGRAALDLAETVSVFIRVFTRAIFFAPYGIGVMFLIALLFSILLLPFLIARYHRAQIVE